MLVAPEPDRQQPHADDEVYVVLEGRGVLEVEGDSVEMAEGKAAFVSAGADHRFAAYEGLSVLVVFSRPHARKKPRLEARPGRAPPPRVAGRLRVADGAWPTEPVLAVAATRGRTKAAARTRTDPEICAILKRLSV